MAVFLLDASCFVFLNYLGQLKSIWPIAAKVRREKCQMAREKRRKKILGPASRPCLSHVLGDIVLHCSSNCCLSFYS